MTNARHSRARAASWAACSPASFTPPSITYSKVTRRSNTFAASMTLAVLSPDDEPDKPLYVGKVVGLALALVGGGVLIYVAGRARRAVAGIHSL